MRRPDAAAKAKAEDVLKQMKAGGNFAELAKKYSDDPGSKDKGGELPMIPTAQLDPAYAKAAMALKPGQTSDLVRSQFGYHIIQTIAEGGGACEASGRGEGQDSFRCWSSRRRARRSRRLRSSLLPKRRRTACRRRPTRTACT